MEKTLIITLFIGWLSVQIQAQEQPVMPSFQFLRAEEDWSFLQNAPPSDDFWRKLKYIPLSTTSGAYLTIGGDVRSEFQTRLNEDWAQPNDDVLMLFQRLMLHADWHMSPNTRIFAQLKSGLTVDRNGPRLPTDVDELDLHQLFLEWKIPGTASRLRVGREELWYGSRRLIEIREGTNVRHSFDGARWIHQNEQGRLDVLFYLYNPIRSGIFDNRISTAQLLWGGYYVWNVPQSPNQHFDFYYLGVRNETNTTRFEAGRARELRHSIGTRHWGNISSFRYNSEALVQFGTFGTSDIFAWTVSTDLSLRWRNAMLQPALGLRVDIISGDEHQGDDILQTFNPLYPRGGYFGLLALVGPSNLMDIHPSFGVNISPTLQWSLDWDFFWRYSLNDGIYLPSGRLNVGSNGSRSRFIGHQPGTQLTFNPNRFWEIELSYFYFITGGFLEDATPGDNLTQAGISFSYKF